MLKHQSESLHGFGGSPGWITNWTGAMSLAFEERVDDVTGNIVVHDGTDGVIPGIYPGVPGNLDSTRWKTLEGVRFRVASAEDEWVYTMGFRAFRPGAPLRDPLDRQLLETQIENLDALRARIGLRLPLARSGQIRQLAARSSRPVRRSRDG